MRASIEVINTLQEGGLDKHFLLNFLLSCICCVLTGHDATQTTTTLILTLMGPEPLRKCSAHNFRIICLVSFGILSLSLLLLLLFVAIVLWLFHYLHHNMDDIFHSISLPLDSCECDCVCVCANELSNESSNKRARSRTNAYAVRAFFIAISPERPLRSAFSLHHHRINIINGMHNKYAYVHLIYWKRND